MAEARVDVPIGCVPDYRTFVRHVWSYDDPEYGRSISGPPWVYRCIFHAEEIAVAEGTAAAIMYADGESIEVLDLSGSQREVRFANLSSLHAYLVNLAAAAAHDEVARTIGEFLMWTLGFRWV